MPIPKPRKGESKDAFISRCMGDSVMVKEYGDQKQRVAICETQWTDKDKHQTKSADMKIASEHTITATRLQIRAAAVDGAEALPTGVCGRLTGVALTYNTPDDYGTVFMPGCLAKTRAEKVSTGKVKLFADHGPFTETHVGVVRSLEDVGDTAVMTADLFDTEAGRAMKEYLEAVLASGADTGLSIGFRPRDKEWRESPDGQDMLLYFKEVELREISITPAPAVPGTDVTSVRREPGEDDTSLLKRALTHILRSLPKSDAQTVFDEVYAASAAKPDTPVSASPEGTASPAQDADRAEIATEEMRSRVAAAYSHLDLY